MNKIKKIICLLFISVFAVNFLGSLQAQNCSGGAKVVRIQIDDCVNPENYSEFFQFITGSAGFNLNASGLSVGVGVNSISKFISSSSTVAKLNAAVGTCGNGPIFLDPYAAPYNGMIPPGSMVIAYTHRTPVINYPVNGLKELCGDSPIFVLVGDQNNSAHFFLNLNCTTGDCIRSINISIGTCSLNFSYDASDEGGNGSYLAIDASGMAITTDFDGCIPFSIPCEKPIITLPLSGNGCKSEGYELPEFSDLVTGNAAYWTEPKRNGTRYEIGKIIFDSMTLYANDINSCNPGVQVEKAIKINIKPGPEIDQSFDGSISTCGYYILPIITGKNLSTDVGYFALRNGIGKRYYIGDTIKAPITLYVIDKDKITGCDDVKQLDILFAPAPNITNLKDTVVPCGINYKLPPIKISNGSENQAYYSLPSKGGAPLAPGTTISNGGKYYIYDEIGSCIDEDTFQIDLITKPIISKTIFQNDTFCDRYIFPSIAGVTVSYYLEPNKMGTKYLPGQSLSADSKIYIVAADAGCETIDSFRITIRKPRIDDIILLPICTDVLKGLPAISGNLLSNKTAYWSNKSGQGTKYFPGDTVHAGRDEIKFTDRIIYAFDSVKYRTEGCSAEAAVTLPFSQVVKLESIKDTILACGLYLKLPPIQPSYLINKKYLNPQDKFGILKEGDTIKSSGDYIVFAQNGNCSDEDTFAVTIEPRPILDKAFSFDTACGEYTLPEIRGVFDSAFYFSEADRKGIKYYPGEKVLGQTKFYIHAGSEICYDTTSINIVNKSTSSFFDNVDITNCGPVLLPAIKGSAILSTAAYYTASQGQGTRRPVGESVEQSTTLYIYDNFIPCSPEDTIQVQILSSTLPDLTISTQSIQACDSVLLPSISGLLGSNYYKLSGGQGLSISPGTWIKSSGVYFAYGGTASCFDEDTITIDLLISPQINIKKDTSLCNELLLPMITGTNLTGTEHYHLESMDQGKDLTGGRDYIDASLRLYAWDRRGHCFDEDTFDITIYKRPVIDSILPINVCEKFVLPKIIGSSLTNPNYYPNPNGNGIPYNEGQIINKSIRLFAFQNNPICPSQRIVDIQVHDSSTAAFTVNSDKLCDGQLLTLKHIGKKALGSVLNWQINGPYPIIWKDISQDSLREAIMPPGNYKIKLSVNGIGCIGSPDSTAINVFQILDQTNLQCDAAADKIVFNWSNVPNAIDYKIEMIKGPTGVRSPYSMIFDGLNLGQEVGIRVTPLAEINCADALESSLLCRTRICDDIEIKFLDPGILCSSSPIFSPPILLIPDTIQVRLSGKGIFQNATGLFKFNPAVSGYGMQKIYASYTKDSCTFTDSIVYEVGGGEVTILNTNSGLCNTNGEISVRLTGQTGKRPYTVYYSLDGNTSSVFPFGNADTFGVSAKPKEYMTIDSVLDANGCKMIIHSLAGTLRFSFAKPISIKDSTIQCDPIAKTFQYQLAIKNTNSADPLKIISGGGIIRDSFYFSPIIPFGIDHEVQIGHTYDCNILTANIKNNCNQCLPIRDSVTLTACQGDLVIVNGKTYSSIAPIGMDTLRATVTTACDTLRSVRVIFNEEVQISLNHSLCKGDFIVIGNKVFDENNLQGSIRLTSNTNTGCDTLINLQITMVNRVVSRIRDTLCSSESIIMNGIQFNQNHLRDSFLILHGAANGCDSMIFYEFYLSQINADIALETEGCGISASYLLSIRNITGGNGPFQYSLGANFQPVARLPIQIKNLPADSFALRIKNNIGCIMSYPVRLPIINKILEFDLGNDKVIKLGDTVQLYIQSNFRIVTIRWYSQSNLSCLKCNNPLAYPRGSALYIAEAIDSNGCSIRDTMRILVDLKAEIFIPNIIKPGSDQEENKFLYLYTGKNISTIKHFDLYDRWGNHIITHQNLNAQADILLWDGTDNNRELLPGVFVYRIIYEMIDGTIKVQNGAVTLIR